MDLERCKQVIPEDFAKSADLIDRVIGSLALVSDSSILDIGTGLGAMCILLALNGFDVLTGQPEEGADGHQHHEHGCGYHGLDWRANARAMGVEDKITFQHLDVESLDFADESFDAVFMYDTLQHVAHRDVALNECLRVAKSTGVVCVIEWSRESIRRDEEEYGFEVDYIDPWDLVPRSDVTFEVFEGAYVNIFLLRKA